MNEIASNTIILSNIFLISIQNKDVNLSMSSVSMGIVQYPFKLSNLCMYSIENRIGNARM